MKSLKNRNKELEAHVSDYEKRSIEWEETLSSKVPIMKSQLESYKKKLTEIIVENSDLKISNLIL